MTKKLAKIIIGVFVLSLVAKVLFGSAMFLAIQRLAGDDTYAAAPKPPSPFVAGGPVFLPEITPGSDLPDAFTAKDRVLPSLMIKGLLGSGNHDWNLRYNTNDDLYTLRPDLEICLRVGGADCYAIAKDHDAEIFSKGDMLLYMHIRHSNVAYRYDTPDDVLRALRKQYPNRRSNLVYPNAIPDSYLSTDWETLKPWQGFAMERMPVKEGNGAYFLTATLKDQSEITIKIVTTAPLDTVKTLLASLDLTYLRKLASPVPFEGMDSLEDYIQNDFDARARNDKYEVPDQETLEARILDMTPKERARVFQSILTRAAREDMSLSGLDILYHPMGEEGLADTRAYLAGDIAQDDPRHAVLAREQASSLPIGSCLSVAQGVTCTKKAEGFRIAAVLRAQTAARAQTDEDVYSEEDFDTDKRAVDARFRDLEAQMRDILKRLIASQASD